MTREDSENVPGVPAGAPKWVTAELVERTIKVWQRFYAAPLTVDDALAMILNVAGLVEVFARGDRHEAVRCPGSGEQS